MKLTKLFLALFAGSLFFVSCSDEDNSSTTPTGDYADGAFVLNEGSTGPTTASVTFIGNDGTMVEDVFTLENPSAEGTGSYLQSIFMDDTRAFIVSGQASKITVVDRYTFKYIASITTGLNNPRYGAIVNGKAYVTNNAGWNTGSDDYLAVINLADYTTTGTIALNDWADDITAVSGKLYVEGGSFEKGTSVIVVNPATSAIEKVIALGDSPESFDEEDGILYVLGSEKISKISTATNEVTGTVPFPESLTGASHIVLEKGRIYFTYASSVYTMDINAITAPAAPLFSNTSIGYLYGLDVHDDKVYVTDGGNFSSNSKAYIYSATGSLLNTYDVGVGPNGFYFND